MVVRVLKQAQKADCFERIICATDDVRIAQVVEKNGVECVLTSECPTGSDRVAQVQDLLHLDLVVNLQGDEPLMSPELLQQVATKLLQDPESWITASSPLFESSIQDPNFVKVQVKNEIAADFRRDLQDQSLESWYVHRGIYAYSRNVLQEFLQAKRTPLEVERSIEPLRILGQRPIHVVYSETTSHAVDLPTDISIVEELLARNPQ